MGFEVLKADHGCLGCDSLCRYRCKDQIHKNTILLGKYFLHVFI
jgi:hypothetical protein